MSLSVVSTAYAAHALRRGHITSPLTASRLGVDRCRLSTAVFSATASSIGCVRCIHRVAARAHMGCCTHYSEYTECVCELGVCVLLMFVQVPNFLATSFDESVAYRCVVSAVVSKHCTALLCRVYVCVAIIPVGLWI